MIRQHHKDIFMCSYVNCLALSDMQSNFLVVNYAVLCLVAQSCLTLFNPMDCRPQGSSVHEDSPGKNTGEGCLGLLQGIFPILGLNPGLPQCRPPGKPKNTGMGSLSLLQGNFPIQELNWGLLHCRRILYLLSQQGSFFSSNYHTIISYLP